MKFFTNAISIIILCTINSVNARSRGDAAAQQPQPAPVVNRPVVNQKPTISNPSYNDLVTYVKNTTNVWDNARGLLRPDFIATIIQKANAAGLESFQIDALLRTARDIHGIFSGNQNKDIATLQAIDNQIASAIR